MNRVKITSGIFKGQEVPVLDNDGDSITVEVTADGQLQKWILKAGQYTELKELPKPAYVIPAPLTIDEGDWKTPYELVRDRIDAGIYNNPVTYPDHNEAKTMTVASVKAAKQVYREAEADITNLFRSDVLTAYAAPKGDDTYWVRAYARAWSDGHGNGLVEVLLNFDNMMDLIKGYELIKVDR